MKMIENLAPWSPLAPPKRQKIAPSPVNRGHAPSFSAAC
jgi:hypothetical protein